MNNQSYQINVHFRVFPEGDIIALWEEDSSHKWISSYMRIGQHGEASRDLIHELEPASKEEYESLLRELGSIGYDVVVL